jgi:mRNA-degrading endonuclease toxin of MazEF toxin-antitoxin module
VKRGDVVLVRIPHASGVRGKKRPAVVVQADAYHSVVKTVVLAEITSNLAMASDPACLVVDVSTPDGKATGLLKNSVVSALVLATVYVDTLDQTLGELSPALLVQLDGCIRAAFGLL